MSSDECYRLENSANHSGRPTYDAFNENGVISHPGFSLDAQGSISSAVAHHALRISNDRLGAVATAYPFVSCVYFIWTPTAPGTFSRLTCFTIELANV